MIIKNRAVRILIFICGILLVLLGLIGLVLPTIPTTPFILLASWCFLKSSQRAHQWLHRQPVFGKALSDWEKYRSIRRSTKIIAITTILISLVIVWLRVPNIWIKYAVTTTLTIVSAFIITRNEGPHG